MSVSFQVAVAKSYELDSVNREAMHDAKATRGKMSFMQRMEADSYNKRVNGQLSDMRRHEDLKDRVDKIALEKTATRKEGAVTGTRGPKIVTHACSKLKEVMRRNNYGVLWICTKISKSHENPLAPHFL